MYVDCFSKKKKKRKGSYKKQAGGKTRMSCAELFFPLFFFLYTFHSCKSWPNAGYIACISVKRNFKISSHSREITVSLRPWNIYSLDSNALYLSVSSSILSIPIFIIKLQIHEGSFLNDKQKLNSSQGIYFARWRANKDARMSNLLGKTYY